MERRPVGLVVSLLFAVVAGPASAANVRIHRAELLEVPAKALPTAGDLSKPSAARPGLSFDAFGGRFVLELEDNSELIARLPPERRQAIADRAQLYAGRLHGKPGSWLRIMRVGGDLYGLIYDGREFYAIAPRRTIETMLDRGGVQSSATPNLIYRASDMEVDLGANFCSAVSGSGLRASRSGTLTFNAVLGEIAAAAAMLPTREVEVGVLGDQQFYLRQGADSEDALIARFNIVDAIPATRRACASR